ncbi:MAG: hypothetical protein Q9157_002812 [Trypethelium eluteriae]
MANKSRSLNQSTAPQPTLRARRHTRSQSSDVQNPASQVASRRATRSASVDSQQAASRPSSINTESRRGKRNGAASSQLEEDAADFDPNPIIEKLPHMLEEASLLLENLEETIDTSVVYQHRGSYHRNSQRNSLSLDPFPRDNNSYIDRNVVLQSLFGDSFSELPHEARPDELLFKANLAVFASDVLLTDPESSEIWERFQSLDLEFPNLFMSSFQDRKTRSSSIEPGSSSLRAETFALALDIRTQFTIMLLKKHQNEPPFDVDDILTQNFLNVSAQGHDQGRKSIRGWQIGGLRDSTNELPDGFRSKIRERIQQVGFHLSGEAGDNAVVDIENLETKYPWRDFVLSAGQWVRHRHLEIDEHVAEFGGESNILKCIIAQRKNMITQSRGPNADTRPGTVQRVANASRQPLLNHPKTRSDTRIAGTGALGSGSRPSGSKKFTGITAAFSGEVSKRKSLETTQAKQALASRAKAPQEPDLPEQPSVPEIFEDDEGGQREGNSDERELSASARRPGRTTLEKAMRFHQSQMNPGKENTVQAQNSNPGPRQKRKRLTFIDPQSDAVTVGSDDPPQAVPQASTMSRSAGKRRQDTQEEEEEDDIEPTQDQGFQTDNRVPDRNRRHPHPLTASDHSHESPPSKKQRPNQRNTARQAAEEEDNEWHPPPDDEDERLVDQDDEAQLSGARAQQTPAPSSYQATAQLKREINAGKERPVQTRRPWSSDAEERLIELVGELGPSYAQIQREDQATTNLFHGRDQVALKDKCRNMRFNYQ